MSVLAKSIVDEQIKSLEQICDLEQDVIQAFHVALLQVAERHLATLSTGSTPVSGEKIKLGKKATKRVTKPKEEKLSSKNAYHFFVAAKMGEVKAAGVEAKGRMKRIGEMWKALSDDERKPFKDMATRYNDYVQNEMKSDDWKARREAIVLAANQHATSAEGATAVSVPTTTDADEEVDEDEEVDDADEVETVVSVPVPVTVTATVTPTPAATKPTQRRTKK